MGRRFVFVVCVCVFFSVFGGPLDPKFVWNPGGSILGFGFVLKKIGSNKDDTRMSILWCKHEPVENLLRAPQFDG